MDSSRRISLVLAATGALVAALAIGASPGRGDYLDRAIETALLVGIVGAALHAWNWPASSRIVQAIQNPRWAWTALAVGTAWVAARAWLPAEWPQ